MIIGTLLIQLLGTETSGRCFWEQSTEIGMTKKNKVLCLSPTVTILGFDIFQRRIVLQIEAKTLLRYF